MSKQTGYNRVAAIKGERIPYIYIMLCTTMTLNLETKC